ncbi:CYFA0S01e04621g1_1 [Cyberlindnera fabianii]|uniref:CYFA0S01e04621g1_1 n=1 Tax=Cyberlindnera fabianii TaxID=36022 RepID=A0A061AQ03_CYBFA|nr:CYFA0S01e04621g1_1 [Cyberlindnera fabianii]
MKLSLVLITSSLLSVVASNEVPDNAITAGITGISNIKPVETQESSSQSVTERQPVEYTEQYFDSLVSDVQQWLDRQMEKVLDLKAMTPEDFADTQKRHKLSSLILQGYYGVPGEKKPNIDQEGIVERLKKLATEPATSIPQLLSKFITEEKELASKSTDADYHEQRAHGALFWKNYAKFLNLDRLEEALDSHDEL